MGSVNLSATVASLIPAGTSSPLRVTSPSVIRATKTVPNAVADDLDTIARSVNALHSSLQAPSSVTQMLLTNQQGQVIAAFGQMVYRGVPFVNWLSELHVGDYTQSGNPTNAVFNASRDGSVSIGGAGWLDVHDPYSGNAAWIGTQSDTLTITGAVQGPGGIIRLTVVGQTLATGNTARVRNMNLAGVPNANGSWTVTAVDSNTLDLQHSVFAGAFTPIAEPPFGLATYIPSIERVLQVSGCTPSGALVEIQTAAPHGYVTGDRVNIPVLPGVPAGVGQWTIVVVDATHFTLDGSAFAGALQGTGTCLRYFAGVLAQQFAIGTSFPGYKLRAFADGSLRINNATISLSNGPASIIIDPTGPNISLTNASSSIVLTPASITMTDAASITMTAASATIVLTPASVVMSSPTATVTLDAINGKIILAKTGSSARIVIDASVPQIQMFDSTGTVSVTINANGTITARTVGSTSGFSGTANVMNTAGTGASTFSFTNGICTDFTP